MPLRAVLDEGAGPARRLSSSAASTTAMATMIVRLSRRGACASAAALTTRPRSRVAALEHDAGRSPMRTTRAPSTICAPAATRVALEGRRQPVHPAAQSGDLGAGGARGAQPRDRRRRASRRRAERVAQRGRGASERKLVGMRSSTRRARPGRRARRSTRAPIRRRTRSPTRGVRLRTGARAARRRAAPATRPAGRSPRRRRGRRGSAGMPSTLAAGSGWARPSAPMSHAGDSRGSTISPARPSSVASAATTPPRVAKDSAAASRSRPAMRTDASCPPTRSDASTSVTAMPSRARSRATIRPATPAPTTMTGSVAREDDDAGGCDAGAPVAVSCQTRAAPTEASWTRLTMRVSTSGSVSGGTPWPRLTTCAGADAAALEHVEHVGLEHAPRRGQQRGVDVALHDHVAAESA